MPYWRRQAPPYSWFSGSEKVKALVIESCQTLCDPMHHSLPDSCPWNSPGKNTGVGSHFLLQGIFPTQGLNSGLLHWRRILYHRESCRSPQNHHNNINQGAHPWVSWLTVQYFSHPLDPSPPLSCWDLTSALSHPLTQCSEWTCACQPANLWVPLNEYFRLLMDRHLLSCLFLYVYQMLFCMCS